MSASAAVILERQEYQRRQDDGHSDARAQLVGIGGDSCEFEGVQAPHNGWDAASIGRPHG
jgi:hypothetical protein